VLDYTLVAALVGPFALGGASFYAGYRLGLYVAEHAHLGEALAAARASASGEDAALQTVSEGVDVRARAVRSGDPVAGVRSVLESLRRSEEAPGADVSGDDSPGV
jgi:hypothetical protein